MNGTRPDIVVNGRDVDVPEHYRVHVAEKMAHVERYDDTILHYVVELFHERNPRQSKVCQRVEITGTGDGPVVRAEAAGPDFYSAFADALAKLGTRLQRSHDRRRVHHGRRQPTSVAEATAALGGDFPDPLSAHPTDPLDDGIDARPLRCGGRVDRAAAVFSRK